MAALPIVIVLLVYSAKRYYGSFYVGKLEGFSEGVALIQRIIQTEISHNQGLEQKFLNMWGGQNSLEQGSSSSQDDEALEIIEMDYPEDPWDQTEEFN